MAQVETIRVGTGKVDITPPFTIPYLGGVPRHGYFQGVHDPLYARAAVLDDGKTQIAIISADMIGYSDIPFGPDGSVVRELGRRVEALTGIPASNVLLAATHAHSTPDGSWISRMDEVPAVGPWYESHLDQLASAVVMATQHKETCVLKVGTGDGKGIAWNRRILGKDGGLYNWHRRPADDQIVDWGVNDHDVGVWLFESVETEQPICVFVNFACHPTTVQVQPLVSADFPGLMAKIMEETLGCTTLFLQGMCGNVRPVSTDHQFKDVQRHGIALAGVGLKVVGTLMQRETKPIGTSIQVVSDRLMMPARDDGPEAAPLEKRAAEADEVARTATDETVRRKAMAEARGARERLRMIDLARWFPHMGADLWACRVGDAAIVTLPGEPFVEFGLQLKEISPAKHTLTVGYTGHYVGYLPNQQAYERGGYEVSYGAWTRLQPGAGEQLTEVSAQMLKGLWE